MTRSGTSLADPDGTGTVVAALSWVEGTLLGTLATVVAIIAIASIGLLMLTGRVDLRNGIRMVLGCFILFGASAIAAGLQAVFAGTLPAPPPMATVSVAVPVPSPPVPAPANEDPYAGASVPPR